MAITFRLAVENDVATLTTMIENILLNTEESNSLAFNVKKTMYNITETYVQDLGNGGVHVALEDSTIIGFSRITNSKIHEMYIKPEKRNLGIAKEFTLYIMGCYDALYTENNADNDFVIALLESVSWTPTYNNPFNGKPVRWKYQKTP